MRLPRFNTSRSSRSGPELQDPGFGTKITSSTDRLINKDGSYTERAHKIIENTPMGRFGDPKELNGIVKYLCSDASKFVTGTVIPVDGGFSSFSGV